MKKSFFKEYFLYKLSSLRGVLVASAVLSVGGLPILVTLFKIIASFLEKENEHSGSIGDEISVVVWGTGLYSMMCLPFVLLGLVVLATITPIISFKFYNKRVCVDTVGSLPLTYNQRFFGDFLSGLAATVAPFLICAPYVLIMAKSAASHEIKELEHFFGIFSHNTLIYAVILASAYTFSTLVVSCCGKVGSSVFYSLFGMLLVPGVVAFYTGFVSENNVGLNAADAIEAIRMIPPLGLFYDFFSFWFNFANTLFSDFGSFHTYNFMTCAVMITLTAAYGVGAYFIGKYRKAERVGRDFVYEGAHLVMLTMVTAAIPGGAFLTASGFKNPAPWLIGSAVVALVTFVAFELSHTKNPKKLPKALLKYAGICAVCFGFFAIVKATEGFGIADIVPNANEISRVEINGEHLFSYDNSALVYDDKDAVEEIISEHKKLLSDKSKIRTGDEIMISYKLKNGLEIKRRYSSELYRDEVKKMSEAISKLPTSSSNVYGVLNSTDYSDLTFEIDGWEAALGIEPDKTESNDTEIKPDRIQFFIKKSKTEEFKQILLNDIKEHYSSDLEGSGPVCTVLANYTRNGVECNEYFWVFEPYEASVKFLLDPDNRETGSISDVEQSKIYTATLYLSGIEKHEYQYMSVEISSENALAKELISMLTLENSEDISERIGVHDDKWLNYRVKKSDEKRASEIILQLAREKIDRY